MSAIRAEILHIVFVALGSGWITKHKVSIYNKSLIRTQGSKFACQPAWRKTDVPVAQRLGRFYEILNQGFKVRFIPEFKT